MEPQSELEVRKRKRSSGGEPAAPSSIQTTASSSPEDEDTPPQFPVRKVVLSKTGIGYFEREDDVAGGQQFQLQFKSSDMNDVLKSLTIIQLPGGEPGRKRAKPGSNDGDGDGEEDRQLAANSPVSLVASVSYESTKPFDKQLDDLSISLNEHSSLRELLTQVKGTPVAVEVMRQGKRETVEGIVIGLESKERYQPECHTAHYLALLVAGRAVQYFDLASIVRLRLINYLLRQDLRRLLAIHLQAKKKEVRSVTGYTRGTGEQRTVRASYIVEAPVWKTTYRLFLFSAPAEGNTSSSASGAEAMAVVDEEPRREPVLEGWALVDNTQNEDWRGVELSLVSGASNSFIYDLYNPRFATRTEVEVEQEETLAPPTLEDAIAQHDVAALAQAEAQRDERRAVPVIRARGSSPPPLPMPTQPAMAYPAQYAQYALQPQQQPQLQLLMQQMQQMQQPAVPGVMAFGAGYGGGAKRKRARRRDEDEDEDEDEAEEEEEEEEEEDDFGECDIPRCLYENEEETFAPAAAATAAPSSVEVEVAPKKMEMADLFQYKITSAVDVLRLQSALVPFVRAPLDGAVKAVVYNKNVREDNPLAVIKFKNVCGVPLEGGPLSLFEDGAYVGEAMLPRVKVNEELFVAYAVDLKTSVTVTESSELREPHQVDAGQVDWERGQLYVRRWRVLEFTYVIDNKNDRPIDHFYLEHTRKGQELVETPEPDARLNHLFRFKLVVPARQTVKFVVKEREPSQETYWVKDVTQEQADQWFAAGYFTALIKETLDAVIQRNAEAAQLRKTQAGLMKDKSSLEEDISRCTSCLDSLHLSRKRHAAAQSKYRNFFTKELNQSQTDHSRVEKEVEALQEQLTKNETQRLGLANSVRFFTRL